MFIRHSLLQILVLVGFPGSGKSSLAKHIEKESGYNYATVCRDVLGSWQKCAAEATKLLEVLYYNYNNYMNTHWK